VRKVFVETRKVTLETPKVGRETSWKTFDGFWTGPERLLKLPEAAGTRPREL